MRAEIYWINENLAIMPRPRGGDWLEDEIESFKQQGVSVVVSLLEWEEVAELDLQHEELFCREKGLNFLSFPICDRQTPTSFEEAAIFVHRLNDLLAEDEKIAIHCRQGVGRSSLIAACVLATGNSSVNKVFETIETARRCTVPDTPEQKEWVKAFCKRT